MVLAAAGRGVRAGEEKLWADVHGRPLIGITLEAISRAACFDEVVVVCSPRRHEDMLREAERAGVGGGRCVAGGERRRDSVELGTSALHTAVDIVCVHDAARPLCPPELFERVVSAARTTGAATSAVPCVDTIKEIADGHVVRTVPREALVVVQTPQAFRRDVLRAAQASSSEDASDECLLVERCGGEIAVVEGDPENRKVTVAADIAWLRAVISR